MRLAINATFFDRPHTGTGQYLRELVPELARCSAKDEYVLVVPQSEYSGDGIREMPDMPARVFLYPEHVGLARFSENLGKVWFEQVVFGRACAREHVTLAHVPYFASPLFPSTRTVVTIHDLIPLILPAYRGSLLVRAYTWLVATAARRADAVIADSECTKRDIVKRLGIPKDRVHVVHLAADSRYRPIEDAARREAVRTKYNLPEKYLLYLGGYDQRKNVRVILEAFALCPELYKEGYRLALAGMNLGTDSPFFPSPERMAREVGLAEDAIQFLGWIVEEDKPALLSGAAVFLFPSLYEGFGLPPLEAMACGTPVVCSESSSLPEIVGSAGILVNPTSPIAWAESIRAVLTQVDRREEMQGQGLAQASRFSWSRTAEETLAVYRSAGLDSPTVLL